MATIKVGPCPLSARDFTIASSNDPFLTIYIIGNYAAYKEALIKVPSVFLFPNVLMKSDLEWCRVESLAYPFCTINNSLYSSVHIRVNNKELLLVLPCNYSGVHRDMAIKST
uniref:Uncharacterized protein n=1 Tax=Nelumbo nucifera TaxID=4432 RepID=A0A822YPV1_NELNU|nr:TPA_asm: hypothetical protein HUJ06_010129 [Nelumbo nucifera]